jgi:hypothetical protein
LGLTAWIYDEMKWPSGPANWQVVEERPGPTQRYLESLGFPVSGSWVAFLTGGDGRCIDMRSGCATWCGSRGIRFATTRTWT